MENCMVSILCTAYNHERYIEQAIKGFLIQDTEYPYEILINDDASTDKTADIIKIYEKKYPDKIKAFYQKENMYSKGGQPLEFLLSHANGKYIALCEGDDFWVSKDKLERQISYLELHENYSASVHAGYNSYENGVIMKNKFRAFTDSRVVTTEEIVSGWLFPTASIIFRAAVVDNFTPIFRGDFVGVDFCLIIDLSLKGNIYYIDECMSVYRRMSVSSITATYEKDTNKKLRNCEQFIALMQRIDEYTNNKYSEIISDVIDRTKFNIYEINRDLCNIKKTNMYISFGFIKKIKIDLKNRFTILSRVIRKKKNICDIITYKINENRMYKYRIPNIVILEKRRKAK